MSCTDVDKLVRSNLLAALIQSGCPDEQILQQLEWLFELTEFNPRQCDPPATRPRSRPSIQKPGTSDLGIGRVA
jgi:hypothetical protein